MQRLGDWPGRRAVLENPFAIHIWSLKGLTPPYLKTLRPKQGSGWGGAGGGEGNGLPKIMAPITAELAENNDLPAVGRVVSPAHNATTKVKPQAIFLCCFVNSPSASSYLPGCLLQVHQNKLKYSPRGFLSSKTNPVIFPCSLHGDFLFNFICCLSLTRRYTHMGTGMHLSLGNIWWWCDQIMRLYTSCFLSCVYVWVCL